MASQQEKGHMGGSALKGGDFELGKGQAKPGGIASESGHESTAEKNPARVEAGRQTASERGHEALSEQGQHGGAARGGQHFGHPDPSASHVQERVIPENYLGDTKDPRRVEAGKKAAETRGQQVQE